MTEDESSSASRRKCLICGDSKLREQFSKTQWKKRDSSKCIACLGRVASSREGNCGVRSRTDTAISDSVRSDKTSPTKISLQSRPQIQVGLDGLTVCSDWPKTKRGQPPGAQSAIFMPLLACAYGEPIEGHFTAEQLEVAQQWWTAALPEWPNWVDALRRAGVGSERLARLFSESCNSSGKAHPNPLIHKAKGRGTVPHLKGTIQTQLLGLDQTVSYQLDACVHCLYLASSSSGNKSSNS